MKPPAFLPRALLAVACGSFLLSACAAWPETPQRVEPSPVRAAAVERGVVRAIDIVDAPAASNGGGALVGGVVGGLLGNQIGSGGGRTAATVAGALGGAFVGNRIEQERHGANAARIHRVLVQFDNGATQTFDYRELDGLRVGDRVSHQGGRLVRD